MMMPCCIESFSFGALIVLLSKNSSQYFNLKSHLLFSLIFFIFTLILSKSNYVGSLSHLAFLFSRTIFSYLCAVLILIILRNSLYPNIKKILNNRYVLYIGKISYGIYIIHHFVPGLLNYSQSYFGFSLAGTGIQIVLNFILSFFIAHLSYVLVESPINRLKNIMFISELLWYL